MRRADRDAAPADAAGRVRAGAPGRTHAATLDRVEKRFGVPREIVVAIWGLETNYGADASARFSIIRSLATLAYDCRRSAFFTGQLLDAIRIVQRGDISASQMRGGWAGEIGQTQFLPSPYIRYAVDFDGDGRRACAACLTSWLRRPIFSRATAGRPASPGTRGRPTMP